MKALTGFMVTGMLSAVFCHAQEVVRWETSGPGFSQQWRSGILTKIINSRQLLLLASVEREGKEIVLRLSVTNDGSEPFDVLPSKITATSAEGIGLKLIDKVAGAKRAQWMQAVGAALSGAGAGLQDVNATRQTATVTDSSGNTSNVYVQRPNDGRAVEANNRKAAADSRAIGSVLAQYSAAVLKAQTLVSGETVRGFLWFSRPKGNLITVSVPLKGEVFEFPFDLSLKP